MTFLPLLLAITAGALFPSVIQTIESWLRGEP